MKTGPGAPPRAGWSAVVRIAGVVAAVTALVVSVLTAEVGAAPAGAAPATRPPKPGSGPLTPRLETLAQPGVRGASATQQAQLVGLPASGPGGLVRTATGEVLVQVRAAGTGAATRDALTRAGLHVTHVAPGYRVITGSIAVDRLSSLAAVAGVESVEEVVAPFVGQASTATASAPVAAAAVCAPIVSEGDVQLQADDARAAFGVDGTDVRVGVLSDSFNRSTTAVTDASDDVASGDLPGVGNPCGRPIPVTVVDDSASGSGLIDEGRAMTQIVHDLAPGARLLFATAFTGELAFADNIRALRNTHNATVIVDDVTYFDEPMFQDGPISVAVNEVTAAGAVYFSSAGNGNAIVGGKSISSYEAPAYRPQACPTGLPAFAGPTCHDFDPTGGTDNGAGFTVANGGGFLLSFQWAQPRFGVTTDLDFYVQDTATNAVLASGLNDNGVTQKPTEIVNFVNTTGSTKNVRVVVNRYSGSGTPRIKWSFFRSSGLSSVEYNQSGGGDTVGPTIFGHNGAGKTVSTAAVPYSDSTTPEPYTSHGPVTLYFGPVVGSTPAASLPAPQVLAKPDLAATDGGVNTFFPPGSGPPFRFYGTSAAAPHAAAVAALMRDRSPSQSPASVLAKLKATADPVPNGGTADVVGSGLVDAMAAVGTAPFVFNAHPGLSTHPVNLTKSVSIKPGKSHACSANFAPACATPSTIGVSAPAFGGKPNALVTIALCNTKALFSPNLDGTGSLGDAAHACDYGNAIGFGPAGVPNSGTLHLDGAGNCCVEGASFNLAFPSNAVLTMSSGPTGWNSSTSGVCPPNPGQIANGYTCAVVVAELDPAAPFAPSRYLGYRLVYPESPIPTMTCGGATCPSPIPAGTAVTLTGKQFPCRLITPDDPTTLTYDAACVAAWNPIQVLLKRVSTGLIDGPAINPTSITSGTNGAYSLTFTMPAVSAPGENYKLVAHAPTCALPCESGKFNAAGKFVLL
jgi:hypothetical protein